jgi:hypothetical protein
MIILSYPHFTEEFLDLHYDKFLVFPFELLPKYEIAENLQLIVRITHSSDGEKPQQLKYRKCAEGLMTALPTQTKNSI